MLTIDFADKSVTYETFVNDVASRLASLLGERQRDPETISQRKAYEMFGRANVDRWRRQGRVSPAKRPGKMEYRTADLRALQRDKQDYLHE